MKKRKTRSGFGIGMLFLFGIGILLYPSISQKWNAYREKRIVLDTAKKIQKIPNKEKKDNLIRARMYNESLVGGIVPDVFAIREGVRDENYENILNSAGNGVMGSILIPAIDVQIPIYHYTTEDVLLKGCGHIFGSSLPVGGKSTHAVLSAHRGLPEARLFTDLDLIKKKDHFFIKTNGKTLAYAVDHIEVVEPFDTRSLAIKKGEDYVTLVTCTPYGLNTKRLLVRGHRVPYEKNIVRREKRKLPVTKGRLFARLICVVIGVFLALVVWKLGNRLHRKKENENCDGNDEIDES